MAGSQGLFSRRDNASAPAAPVFAVEDNSIRSIKEGIWNPVTGQAVEAQNFFWTSYFFTLLAHITLSLFLNIILMLRQMKRKPHLSWNEQDSKPFFICSYEDINSSFGVLHLHLTPSCWCLLLINQFHLYVTMQKMPQCQNWHFGFYCQNESTSFTEETLK